MRSPWQLVLKSLRINNMQPGFKKYLINTGWVFGEKGLRLVSGLFIGAYVARYLGPARYGLLGYAISLVTFCSAIAGLGLDQILVRELTRYPDKKTSILGTGFVLKFTAALLVVALLMLTSKYAGSLETAMILCIIGGGLLFESFGVIDFYFQAKVSSRYSVWGQMISLSVISIIRVYLVLSKASLIWFAGTYALDYVLVAMGFLFFYTRNQFSIFKWNYSAALAKEFLKSSWPMIFASLSVAVYMKIDQILIKWMLGDVATGQYGVAVRLCELWYFVPVAICASVFPAILNAKAISEELYLARLQKLYDLMVAISVAIAIPMTFLSGWIVRILFGEAFAPAADVLNLYIWSGIFVFLGVANGKWLISENQQFFVMASLVTACVLNIVLNLILIPVIGLRGSALATLIAYSFASYFSWLFTKKTRPMFRYFTRSLYLPGLIKRNIRSK